MMKGIPTGFKDMHGNDICIGDQTRLVVDGEERIFDVCFKSVEREVVTYKDFEPNSVKVMIRGIVFSWKGHDLLPCIDEFGNIDTSSFGDCNGECEYCEMQQILDQYAEWTCQTK